MVELITELITNFSVPSTISHAPDPIVSWHQATRGLLIPVRPGVRPNRTADNRSDTIKKNDLIYGWGIILVISLPTIFDIR